MSKKLLVLAATVCFLTLPAKAAEPGYFRVAGVAANDVLNIRMEPNAGAALAGELAPGAGPVEVLEVRSEGGSEWGRVIAADGNGWVAMRFLEPLEIETIAATAIPDGLSCSGTEPFWGLRLSKNAGMKLERPDAPPLTAGIEEAVPAIGRMHRFAVTGSQGGIEMKAILGRHEQCTDGMSDRDYGWRIDLLLENPGSADYPQLYEGCCMLPLPK